MGLAVRRSSPRATVIVGFGTGLVAAVAFAVFQQPTFEAPSVGWGLLAGLAQGLGWIAFASALDKAHMALAAPAAATTTTALLYSGGLLLGQHVEPIALLGLIVALVALVVLGLTQSEPTPEALTPPIGRRRGVAHAILAGGLFAVQALVLLKAGTSASSLVLIGTGLGVVGLLCLTLRLHPLPDGQLAAAGRHACVGGVAIFVGDAVYLYALQGAAPVISTVVAQMHPMVTAVLATCLLRERPTLVQAAGLLLAICGVTLIGVG